MDIYGVLGHPIGHSRSPAMHNRAFAALGLRAIYLPFEVHPSRLGDAVRGLDALGVKGWNVTLPHKTSIMSLLDEVDGVARSIGAVNTVLRDGTRLVGTNTDAEGLTRSLREAGVGLEGARATVLGSGGAARASIVGLARAGVRSIGVAGRNRERVQALISDLTASLAPVPLEADILERSELTHRFAHTDVLIQATSATLDGGPAAERFAEELPVAALPATAVVTDLVYRPRETALLRRAAERGLRTVDGLGMLLHQGALAFECWTRKPAPLGQMRAVLLEEPAQAAGDPHLIR